MCCGEGGLDGNDPVVRSREDLEESVSLLCIEIVMRSDLAEDGLPPPEPERAEETYGLIA